MLETFVARELAAQIDRGGLWCTDCAKPLRVEGYDDDDTLLVNALVIDRGRHWRPRFGLRCPACVAAIGDAP